MSQRANQVLAVALWVVPLAIGIAIASMFMASGPGENRIADRDGEGEPTLDEGPLEPSDWERLQGAWECSLLERDGKVVYRGLQSKQARVTFQDETVTFEDGGTILQGTFRLEPTRKPKTFDLTILERDGFVTYPSGIYELENNSFRLCFAFPSRVRPTSFETSAGSGRTLFVYRRIPSEPGGRSVLTTADRGIAFVLSDLRKR